MHVTCVRIVLGAVGGLSIVFGVGVSSAWAQAGATIRGQVVAADGSMLPGAPVALRSGAEAERLETTADQNGRFVFIGVRPGEHVLSTAPQGFARREVRLVVAPREVRSVTLSLEVAPIVVTVDVVGEAALPSTHSPSSTLRLKVRLTTAALVSLGVAGGVQSSTVLSTTSSGSCSSSSSVKLLPLSRPAVKPPSNGW